MLKVVWTQDSHLFIYSTWKKYFNIFEFMIVLGISNHFNSQLSQVLFVIFLHKV